MPRLVDLATTVRSKNAGVDHITFDIIFSDATAYRRVLDSGALTREAIARLYNVALEEVTHFVNVDAAPAIKFTLRRIRPAGRPERRTFSAPSSIRRCSRSRSPE